MLELQRLKFQLDTRNFSRRTRRTASALRMRVACQCHWTPSWPSMHIRSAGSVRRVRCEHLRTASSPHTMGPIATAELRRRRLRLSVSNCTWYAASANTKNDSFVHSYIPDQMSPWATHVGQMIQLHSIVYIIISQMIPQMNWPNQQSVIRCNDYSRLASSLLLVYYCISQVLRSVTDSARVHLDYIASRDVYNRCSNTAFHVEMYTIDVAHLHYYTAVQCRCTIFAGTTNYIPLIFILT